jgi:hypothetical protein
MILSTTLLVAQSQLVPRGQHAIGIGIAGAANEYISSADAAITATYAGRLDVSVAYGILSTSWQSRGKTLSFGLEYYLLRAEKSGFFAAFQYSHIQETIKERSYFSSYRETDRTLYSNSYGFSLGLLNPGTATVALLPSAHVGLLYLVNPSNPAKPAYTFGAQLAVVIPVSEHSVFAPAIAYGYANEVSSIALALQYNFRILQ